MVEEKKFSIEPSKVEIQIVNGGYHAKVIGRHHAVPDISASYEFVREDLNEVFEKVDAMIKSGFTFQHGVGSTHKGE